MQIKTAVLFLFVATATARPSLFKRDANLSDEDVLNLFLRLEHVANAFYSDALGKFSMGDFTVAGLEPWARGRFSQIAAHEADHVKLLDTALGDSAVQPCSYNFAYDGVKGFVGLSAKLEQIGSSAYTGGLQYLSNKDYATAAATILSTKARHSAWIESAVRHGAAWGTAYETPLDLNSVYTLVSQFATACPDSNPTSFITANAALATVGNVTPGSKLTLQYEGSSGSDELYAAFLNGQNVIVVPLSSPKTEFTVPSGLAGYSYLIVTKDGTGLDAHQTIAGPTIIDISFNANDAVAQIPL